VPGAHLVKVHGFANDGLQVVKLDVISALQVRLQVLVTGTSYRCQVRTSSKFMVVLTMGFRSSNLT
jgi:hypothetical protein